MAYAQQPVAPKPRPPVVSVAVYLMYLVAAMQLTSALVGLAMLSNTEDAMREAYAGFSPSERDLAITTATIGTIVGIGIGVLLAVALVVLAILNGKGKNPARIVTWVLGGLLTCCGVVGVAATLASGAIFKAPANSNAPDPAQVQRIVDEHLPSWYKPVTTGIQVIGLLAIVGVLILLTLPAAHEFFRKPPVPQAWEPMQMAPPLPGAPPAGGFAPPAGAMPPAPAPMTDPGSPPPPPSSPAGESPQPPAPPV